MTHYKLKSTLFVLAICLLCQKITAQNIDFSPKKVSISDTLSVKKHLIIDLGGKLGIGINTPDENFHVKGNALIDSGRIVFRNTGNSIFIGDETGLNTDFSDDRINVFVGGGAGKSNITGFSNVYIGSNAGNENEIGDSNVAIGEAALANNKNSANVAIGKFALGQNINGRENFAIGNYAGFGTTGSQNLFLGSGNGESSTGSRNVFIGNEVGTYTTENDKLKIHNSNSNQPLLDGDFANRFLKINGKIYSKNEIGVKTDTPKSAIDVNGTIGIKVHSNLESGTDDIDDTAGIWIFTTNGGTIDLPNASDFANRTYTIVNKTAGSLTISTYKDMTNTASTSIASATSIQIVSDGTDWQQIK